MREVYPVLMRDCAYSNCHGAQQRFFQVWGPGRTRLETVDKRTPIQEQEKLRSFQRAISMLYTDGSRPLIESPLLVKPLEAQSGGAAHGGVDHYGRNVYRSRLDPAYLTLLRWAFGGAAPSVAGGVAPALPFGGSVAPQGVGATSGTLAPPSAGASAPTALAAGNVAAGPAVAPSAAAGGQP